MSWLLDPAAAGHRPDGRDDAAADGEERLVRVDGLVGVADL